MKVAITNPRTLHGSMPFLSSLKQSKVGLHDLSPVILVPFSQARARVKIHSWRLRREQGLGGTPHDGVRTQSLSKVAVRASVTWFCARSIDQQAYLSRASQSLWSAKPFNVISSRAAVFIYSSWRFSMFVAKFARYKGREGAGDVE